MSGIVGGAGSKSGIVGQTEIDYEIGTYVPSLDAASGTVTAKSGEDTLAYTKIGNRVLLTGKIELNSVSGPSGNFTVSLPYTVGDVSDFGERFAQMLVGSDFGNGNMVGRLGAVGWAGSNYIYLYDIDSTSGGTPYSMSSHLVATSNFYFSLNYIAAGKL